MKWISAKDELPPMHKDVLIHDGKDIHVAHRVETVSTPTRKVWMWIHGNSGWWYPREITHWMELPAPAEDCENEKEEEASIEFIYKPPHVDDSPIEFFDLPKILHHEEWINLPHILHEEWVELKEYIGKTLRHIVDIIPSNSGEPTYVDFDICISYEGDKIVVVPEGENASRIMLKVRIQGEDMVGIAPDEKYEMHFSCPNCKWIKCSDKLPEKDDVYIVYTKKNPAHPQRFASLYDVSRARWSNCWQEVTHWMPIPEGPEEDE